MPKEKRNHDANRHFVCLLCFEKSKTIFPITGITLQRVKKYWMENYDEADPRLPAAVCAKHHKMLACVETGQRGATIDSLPDPLDYSKMAFPIMTRGAVNDPNADCKCTICRVAQENCGTVGNKFASGSYAGRPSEGGPQLPPGLRSPKPITVWQCCLTPKGQPHPIPCNITTKRANLQALYEQDPRGKEQLAVSVYKEKAAAATATSSSSVGLASGSREYKLPLPPTPQSRTSKALFKDKPVPVEELKRFQTSMSFSGQQMKDVMAAQRTWFGAQTFESGALEKLREMDKDLLRFFAYKECEMEVYVPESEGSKKKKKVKVKRIVVYCKDLKGLIEYLIHKGHHLGELLKKMGMDDGGEFLKFCLALVKVTDFSPVRKGTRSTYSQGVQGNKFSDTGTKKVTVVAIVEDVAETWHNIWIVFSLLNITTISFISSTDMKMANVVLGLGTCSSTYPCCYCIQPKAAFLKELFAGGTPKYPLRKIGEMRRNAELYQAHAARSNAATKPSSAQWFNCENPPLVDAPDDALVIDIWAPMGLHLHLGISNDLYKYLKKGKPELAQLWSQPVGQLPKQWGGQWNGEQCEKLMNRRDALEQIFADHLRGRSAETGRKFIDILNAYAIVKHSCFGLIRQPGWEQAIQNFGNAYLKLAGDGPNDLHITPKVHFLCCHVRQFLERNPENNWGLAKFAEHEFESIHQEMGKLWTDHGYKRTIGHENYADSLLKMTVVLNSRHSYNK